MILLRAQEDETVDIVKVRFGGVQRGREAASRAWAEGMKSREKLDQGMK